MKTDTLKRLTFEKTCEWILLRKHLVNSTAFFFLFNIPFPFYQTFSWASHTPETPFTVYHPLLLSKMVSNLSYVYCHENYTPLSFPQKENYHRYRVRASFQQQSPFPHGYFYWLRIFRGRPSGVLANMLDWDITVRIFKSKNLHADLVRGSLWKECFLSVST